MKATFAAGCYWCTEAIFQRLSGVENVMSGFTGGSVKNPTYMQVVSGASGHVEAIQLDYEDAKISYDRLLEIFFATHDPTSLDQQDYDVGPMYRSIIFYHSDQQKKLAQEYIHHLDSEAVYSSQIVTELHSAQKFYVTEDRQRSFYNKNPGSPYCKIIIEPKLKLLIKLFGSVTK